jgi:YesN/AraC family two-component response regulator
LLADDEPFVLKTLAETLRRHAFDCTTSDSGEEVLSKLAHAEYDALVIDLLMPGYTGLSLVEKAAQLAPGMPVIIFTGVPTFDTAVRSIQLPVAAYLTKPVDIEELVGVLDSSILKLRTYRTMRQGRKHLQEWDREIGAALEQFSSRAVSSDGQVCEYFRMTLRHVMLVLSQLEQATGTLESCANDGQMSRMLDRELALRRAVDVLRRTKQSFKSRELAELRKELERLLDETDDQVPATRE